MVWDQAGRIGWDGISGNFTQLPKETALYVYIPSLGSRGSSNSCAFLQLRDRKQM